MTNQEVAGIMQEKAKMGDNMIIIDVNLMQTLFGEYWKLIVLGLLVITAFFLWRKNTKEEDWLENAQKRQQTRFRYMNPHITPKEPEETPPVYQAQNNEWSPTGWIYDKEKETWMPPDYLQKESAERWEWDESKKIWIDRKKQAKKEADPNCPVKLVRNGPTYEEWKNQHYKEVYERLTAEAEKRQQQKENPRE